MADAELATFQGEGQSKQQHTDQGPQSNENQYNPGASAPNEQEDNNANNDDLKDTNKNGHKVIQNTIIIFLFYMFSSFNGWIGLANYCTYRNNYSNFYSIAFTISHSLFCFVLIIVILDLSYNIDPETLNRVRNSKNLIILVFIMLGFLIGSIFHIIGMIGYHTAIWDDFDYDDDDNDPTKITEKLSYWGFQLPILLWNWYFAVQYIIIKKENLLKHLFRLMLSGFIVFITCLLFLPEFIEAAYYYDYDERYASQFSAMSWGLGLIAFCSVLVMVISLGLIYKKLDNSCMNKDKIVMVLYLVSILIFVSFIIYFVSYSCSFYSVSVWYAYSNVWFVWPLMFGCFVIAYDIMCLNPRKIVA